MNGKRKGGEKERTEERENERRGKDGGGKKKRQSAVHHHLPPPPPPPLPHPSLLLLLPLLLLLLRWPQPDAARLLADTASVSLVLYFIFPFPLVEAIVCGLEILCKILRRFLTISFLLAREGERGGGHFRFLPSDSFSQFIVVSLVIYSEIRFQKPSRFYGHSSTFNQVVFRFVIDYLTPLVTLVEPLSTIRSGLFNESWRILYLRFWEMMTSPCHSFPSFFSFWEDIPNESLFVAIICFCAFPFSLSLSLFLFLSPSLFINFSFRFCFLLFRLFSSSFESLFFFFLISSFLFLCATWTRFRFVGSIDGFLLPFCGFPPLAAPPPLLTPVPPLLLNLLLLFVCLFLFWNALIPSACKMSMFFCRIFWFSLPDFQRGSTWLADDVIEETESRL